MLYLISVMTYGLSKYGSRFISCQISIGGVLFKALIYFLSRNHVRHCFSFFSFFFILLTISCRLCISIFVNNDLQKQCGTGRMISEYGMLIVISFLVYLIVSFYV